MKYKLFPVLFLIGLFCISSANAQGLATQKQTIIDDLQTVTSANQGFIKIESDSKITALLGTPSLGSGTEQGDFIKMNGYRIRVFMGNNPKTAKAEAFRRESLIKLNFPEIATYVSYDAPNWRLVAGDFMTKDEANLFRQKMQRILPEFGKEMFTISDKVKVPAVRY